MSKILLLMLCLLLAAPLAFGQDDEEDPDKKDKPSKEKKSLRHAAQVHYLVGGELGDTYINFKTGFGFHYAALFKFDKHVYIGPGVGIDQLGRAERFFPLFVQAEGYRSATKDGLMLRGKLGYAFATNPEYERYNFEGFDFAGGFTFEIGTGYRFEVKDQYYLIFGAAFRQQYARIEYADAFNARYEQDLNYMLLNFSVAVHF